MRGAGAVTVGVDVGSTGVKALAVGADGAVVARARVPHRMLSDAPDHLAHDANAAWRRGPRKAYDAVTAQAAAAGRPVAGVCVSAMVPSLAAVDRRGRALTPGLLYGDARGRPDGEAENEDDAVMPGAMRDAEGFLRWTRSQAPDAAGFWPAQAVASHTLSGVPAVDTAMTASLGALHTWGKWDEGVLAGMGVDVAQMPQVFPMAEPAAVIPGSETVIAGGTVDALCDQIVAGASQVGDVLAICGATLVLWIVTDTWLEAEGLWTVPHTVPDRVLIGGASNAGAIFVDWARALVGRSSPARRRPAPDEESLGRDGPPQRPPVWLPYVRGERSPFHDPRLRASLHGLDVTHTAADVVRAAHEASGFVIRTLIDRAGVDARRVVASGGGTRAPAWMAAIADATGLPVDTVAVPEGAAYGAAYLARMAAGLAGPLEDAAAWARVGRRIEPDPAWQAAADERYRRFAELRPQR